MTDDGKSGFTAGSIQTPKLTLKQVVVDAISSTKTYKCSVKSGMYSNSGWFQKDVKVSPLSELLKLFKFMKICYRTT